MIDKGNEYLPKEVMEFFQAAFLFDNAIQSNYEAELIGLYDTYNITFKNSPYTHYVEPLIKPIRDYQEIVTAPFKPDMVLIRDTIESFESLMERFRGRKVYIDVWATWCNPCKREFEHNSALKQYLKEQDTDILYISIDEDNRVEKWEEMIKYFNLEGVHVRTQSQAFKDQLFNMFSDGKGYISIPWYILVDEEGAIVEKHAKAPSQLVSQ